MPPHPLMNSFVFCKERFSPGRNASFASHHAGQLVHREPSDQPVWPLHMVDPQMLLCMEMGRKELSLSRRQVSSQINPFSLCFQQTGSREVCSTSTLWNGCAWCQCAQHKPIDYNHWCHPAHGQCDSSVMCLRVSEG